MNYSEALKQNLFQSGDVIFYFDGSNLFDVTIESVEHSLIYHTGVIISRPNNLMLYQSTDKYGVNRVSLSAALAGQTVILVKPGLWSKEAEDFADSKIGSGYGWLNTFLIDFYLNQDVFGLICSTYVGSVLNKAGAGINLRGLTPTRLATVLAKKDNQYLIEKE